jgi:hypothetical protein
LTLTPIRAENPTPGSRFGELGVGARKTVDAAVKAALVGIEGPVEAHVLDPVQG